MDKIIDRAAKKTKAIELPEESERPRKKSKKSKKHEEEEVIPPPVEVFDEKVEAKRKELKILMLNYPSVQIEKILEIQALISKMGNKEVVHYLDNFKIAVGLQSPMETPENVVGMIGIILQRYYNDPNIHAALINDVKLISSIEQIVPSLGDWLNIPLQVVHRISCHISNAKYGENNKTFEVIEKNKGTFD